MKRQELLSQLNNAQNNFMYGVAGLSLLAQANSRDSLDSLTLVFQETSFSTVSNPSHLLSVLQKSASSQVALFPLIEVSNHIRACDGEEFEKCQKEFFLMLVRAFIRESFEAIKKYCDSSGSKALFEGEDWYHFGKIVRNCFSHDNLIQYNTHQKNRLPIIWREKRFTVEMNGRPLDTSIFSIRDVFTLYQDMRNFVENSLL